MGPFVVLTDGGRVIDESTSTALADVRPPRTHAPRRGDASTAKDRAVDDGTVPGLPLDPAQARQPAVVLRRDHPHA